MGQAGAEEPMVASSIEAAAAVALFGGAD
jgi:hypothetical protein